MVQNLRINKDEFTEEQINQLIEDNNITIKLTNKRKKLLAVLLHLNGLDNKDEQGRFFIDNLWLSQFVGMTETNMLIALRYLQRNDIIERETGSNHKCSRYKIINRENNSIDDKNNSINQKTVVQNNSIDDKNNSINQKTVVQNNSRDRDIELDKDIDIESDSESHKDSESDIYNILNKINNILNKILEEKEKDTLMEETLQEQINELKKENNQLQEQNKILTARLNNAAKQFKVMMNTMRELQQKENKPSTTFSNEVVEDVKEAKKEQTPTVEERKDKEQVKTIDVEVKPSTAFCGDADAKKELSPIEELNETFDVEAIVEYFKENFRDPKVVRQREIELLKEFNKAHLSYGNRRDLELRLNKYIKSLEIINSTPKEEVPQEVQEPIEDVKEVKKEETIPTVAQLKEELPQEAIKEVEEPITSRKEEEATEGKESTFVGMFQEVKGDSSVGEERLRYKDLKSKTYYSSIEEAKAANVNPMFLYDYEVSRCVSTFN